MKNAKTHQLSNILLKPSQLSIICVLLLYYDFGRTPPMTTPPRSLASALFPVGLLLIAMASIQSGASLAKSMFPIVGAQGTTTLRLIFASVIMLLLLRPWRARLTAKSLRTVIVYGMALGGMNFLFYMSLRTVPLGIAVALEFTGPLAVAIYASRRAVDFFYGLALRLRAFCC